MITVKNAESYLKDKIGDDIDGIKKVWDVFKEFCKEPVEGEEDKQILFECGIYDFTGEELFHFGFVRQFSIIEDDGYDHMEQLHCEFLFKPIDVLSKLEVVEWSMDYNDLEAFFNHIENLQEFKIPLNLKPISSEIYQEEV
ncbi:hypothetical protein M3610_10475 [Neobacillus sp. MER 74]|uniref:hypothetical protein n=1 Tax=Neobacillus sp. MER 74 TaxID=2939566 RepID=UPI002041A4F8|nr:hypothetical protein [Neobacillus sp. MER 74]MCM3115713.1 hypothetical protein [Neobacillus sp. MER 74]